jgi:hypothetical protein
MHTLILAELAFTGFIVCLAVAAVVWNAKTIDKDQNNS